MTFTQEVQMTAGPVLVVGATGKQGGAVARSLLGAGVEVRSIARNPESDQAIALRSLGATLLPGNWDDVGSLTEAARGARAVFSVQTPDMRDPFGDAEVRYARNLLAASEAAGVERIVHSSVAGVENIDLSALDGERIGAYTVHYWRCKKTVEDLVRDSGIGHWTILRPSTFMENFIRPSMYFAESTSNRILVATDPDVRCSFVAVEDIGKAALAVLADPTRFDHAAFEVFGDVLTYREVADTLTAALGEKIEPPQGAERARAAGLMPAIADLQEFTSLIRSEPDRAGLTATGIATTSFAQWAQRVFA
jgi:uncharacterized protein YbjT (DUF2867 family)